MKVTRYWRPIDVARYWGLHPETIRRRVRSGDIPAVKLPSGDLRIAEQDALSYGRRVAASARRITRQ